MLCDSKHQIDRSSARGNGRVRRAALHRPDPRRPRPIYATTADVLLQFLEYHGRARSLS